MRDIDITRVDIHELEFLRNELINGIVLNPFWVIRNCVWEGNPRKMKKTAEIFSLVTELFLDCTGYRVSEDATLREGEKELMTAMLIYLTLEAPLEEQNANMLTMLVRADIQDDYSLPSDLERLFNLLKEKDEEHVALTHFNAFLSSPAGRTRIIKSMGLRLCPLYSFQTEGNIFELCGANEIFEMALSLLHNCGDSPEPGNSMENKKDEIAFIAAALYLLYEAYPQKKQTSEMFYKLLNNPGLVAKQMTARSNVRCAAKYWELCSKNILKGRYDKALVRGIEKFFGEFK